jgi:hypothetical protein
MNFKKILIYNFLLVSYDAASRAVGSASGMERHTFGAASARPAHKSIPTSNTYCMERGGGGASIQGEANLLRPGNGQTDLANTSICVMKKFGKRTSLAFT